MAQPIKGKKIFPSIECPGYIRIFDNYLPRLMNFVVLLFLLFFVIKCISVAMTTPFSFDGGMNVQAAQNLLRNIRYATSYGSSLEFDPVIQTGITVILPVAINFMIFGESFTSGLMINALYMIFTVLGLSYYLFVCYKVNRVFLLLALLFFLGIPGLFDIGFGLYGEIPMLFYFFLTLIFLHKNQSTSKPKFIFIAGIFLGLGYLTKTVILIAIPAILFVHFTDFSFLVREYKYEPIKQMALFFLGFLIPVMVFELYRVISLGVPAYFSWWQNEYSEILQHAGLKGGFSDTAGIISKLITHLNLLSVELAIPVIKLHILLAVILFFSLALVFYRIFIQLGKKETSEALRPLISSDFLILLFVTLSYFGWWLIITPTARAYYRRIMVGNILLDTCYVIIISLLFLLIIKITEKSKKKVVLRCTLIISMLFLISLSVFRIWRTENHIITFQNVPSKEAALKAGDFIKNLSPQADIYGYGWWQAPVVSFSSGRAFKNIYFSPGLEEMKWENESYLVVDEYAYALDQYDYLELISKFENQMVFSYNNIHIYKFFGGYSNGYPEFTGPEKKQVSNNSIDFLSDDFSKAFVRNVYIHEDNVFGKWAQKLSAYLFKYDGEKLLRIIFVAQDLNQYDNHPIQLDITMNNVLSYSYIIDHPGVHELIIPIRDGEISPIEVSLACNSQLLPEYASRGLSIFMVRIELMK